MRQETAALRDFDAVDVRFGSITAETVEAAGSCMSASPKSGQIADCLGMSALCQQRTHAPQHNQPISITSSARASRVLDRQFLDEMSNFIALLGSAVAWPLLEALLPGPVRGAIFPIKSNRVFAVLARSRDLPRARSRVLPAPPGRNS